MMTLPVSGFDWDAGNRAKCQDHGVSIEEIEALFARGPPHCARSKTLGGRGPSNCGRDNSSGRPLFVAFTLRTSNGRRLVRPVTARYMHAREIAAYEKAATQGESAPTENR